MKVDLEQRCKFQYKVWAEMLTAGVHTDANYPSAASMMNKKPNFQSMDLVMWLHWVMLLNILSHTLSPNVNATRADKK